MPSKTPPTLNITRARNTPGRWATDTEPNIDIARLCAYRLGRVREQLKTHDYAACVLYDSINIRYATGARDNAIWTVNFHYMARYCFVPAEGPVVLFDIPFKINLPRAEADVVDEMRPARLWRYMIAGARVEENVKLWADEIADLVSTHGGGNRRLAIDHCEPLATTALIQRMA